MSETTTDWLARRTAVAEADGDEWDRLTEEFDAAWREAYAEAFVSFAMSRGWSRENAESWPSEIWRDALIFGAPDRGYDPVLTAQADVLECEVQ